MEKFLVKPKPKPKLKPKPKPKKIKEGKDVKIEIEKRVLERYEKSIKKLMQKEECDIEQFESYSYNYKDIYPSVDRLDKGRILLDNITTGHIEKLTKEPYKISITKLNLIPLKINFSSNPIDLFWGLFNNILGYDENVWYKLVLNDIVSFKTADNAIKYHKLDYDLQEKKLCYLYSKLNGNESDGDIYHTNNKMKDLIIEYLIDYEENCYSRRKTISNRIGKDCYNYKGLYYNQKALVKRKYKEEIDNEIENLVDSKIIYKVDFDGTIKYCLKKMYDMERYIENIFEDLNNGSDEELDDEDEEEIKDEYKDLDDDQIEAVKMILEKRFSILYGGPGRGKTHTISAAIGYWLYNNSYTTIICSTIAGTAVNQLKISLDKKITTMEKQEALEERRNILQLGTFMKKIIYNKDLSKKNLRSDKNKNRKYIFVIDETSMVNTSQMYSLLKKIHVIGYSKCKLVLMGDPDQLNSIGNGDILNDLINSKRFYQKELITVYRTDNTGIISALDSIKKNEFSTKKLIPTKYQKEKVQICKSNFESITIQHTTLVNTQNNYAFYERKQDEFEDKFLKKIKKLKNEGKITGKNAIFISPQNGPRFRNEGIPTHYTQKSWFMSVNYMNIKLRDIFNPYLKEDGSIAKVIKGSKTYLKKRKSDFSYLPYQVGDRIIMEQNDYPDKDDDDDEPDIYKGMLGTIDDYKINSKGKSIIYIKFDDIKVPFYTKKITLSQLNSGDYLTLGYAITIHKAQGMTKENVFISVMNNHNMWRNNGKQLGYVALSRAKKNIYLYTNGNTIDYFKKEKIRSTGIFKKVNKLN